jgi:V8-like Glu-specific endopeptidase
MLGISAIFMILFIPLASSQPAESFDPKTREECLKATVRIKMTDISGTKFYGSGFFLNEENSTYIYTNAHVIDGAENIEILDNDGVAVNGIEWIETFAEPFGKYNGPSSGDGVRLKLSKLRNIAFSMTSEWGDLSPGHELIVFGDNDGANDGKQQIEILSGELKSISEGILMYDCKTRPGSSGGAVVDGSSFKVVGLNTWGSTLAEDPYDRMLGLSQGEGAGFGTLLKNPKWKKFSVKDYLAQGKAIRRMRDNLELMIILTYLVPTAHGIYANLDEPFVRGMKVGDAIKKHEKDPLMGKLFLLAGKLNKNDTSNIKMSPQDTYKIYIKSLESIIRDRDTIVTTLQTEKLSYYHKNFLESRLINAGSINFSDGISACLAWFKKKTGVGGRIPVGEWEDLPPFGQKLSKQIEEKLMKE